MAHGTGGDYDGYDGPLVPGMGAEPYQGQPGPHADSGWEDYGSEPYRPRPHRSLWFLGGAFSAVVALGLAAGVDEIAESGHAVHAVVNKLDGLAHHGAAGTNQAAGNKSAEASASPAAASCIAALPLDMKLGQTLVIGVLGPDLAADESFFAGRNIGGAVIMTPPANPEDGSINQFKTHAGRVRVLIGSDEEGGASNAGGVQRFRSLGSLPLAETAGKTMAPDQLKAEVADYGKKLKQIGIDEVYGPVADVIDPAIPNPLPGRMYSSVPKTVADFDAAAVEGWQAAGILPTLKHFPGLGTASGNTDKVPATTAPLAELESLGNLVPYAQLHASGAAVMVGSQVVPGLTGSRPANQSPEALDLLRNKLGFQNALVVTDSLSAAAIPDPVAAAVNAEEAGVDMAMIVSPAPGQSMGQEVDAVIGGLKNAVATGHLTVDKLNASAGRILAAKHVDPCTILKK